MTVTVNSDDEKVNQELCNMDSFVGAHRAQLESLNISEALYQGLYEQLLDCFRVRDGTVDPDNLITQGRSQTTPTSSPYGALVVVPHVISWEISNHKGMLNELNKLSNEALQGLYSALCEQVWFTRENITGPVRENDDPQGSRSSLINAILQSATWSRVILYRSHRNIICAALPAPPYYPQCEDICHEADLTGPFPFQYLNEGTIIDTSLVYLSPDFAPLNGSLPTLDLVPRHICPNDVTRHVRYVALLGTKAPLEAIATTKLLFAEFTREHHLKRQTILEVAAEHEAKGTDTKVNVIPQVTKPVLKVYTDTNDSMQLGHTEAGLDPEKYQIVDNFEDADVIFSYQSLFAVLSKVNPFLQDSSRAPVYINQFPYEGAFLQKDHLALEVLKQHGLPRPEWSIETYDLDVHLGVFVGAAILAREERPNDEPDPVWIVKPAKGTQSKGHLITRSTARILRLVDAGVNSWVVQRYIERPVCYRGRKIDCRCIVMLCSAQWKPEIYMHKRVYFRIAHKKHTIDTETDLLDHEAVLTANHLLDQEQRTTEDSLVTLPVDVKTIAVLESEYAAFEWKNTILPQIHDMIRELFNGMSRSFPGMAKGRHFSRAVYGVDVMFEVATDESIQVKLTEVTFCPANNAICDAYERDEELYRTYNTDVFDCLFRQEVSERIVRLQ